MSHSRFLVASAALALLLAACGGGGSLTPAAGTSQQDVGSPPGQHALAPQSTASPSPSPIIQASGTITNIFSNGFTLQTGQPHGYINVYTSSSTQYGGAKPFNGESVSVAATGSWLTSLQAITVTQAGFATPSPLPTATPPATATPSPTPAAFPTPTIQTSGTITGLFSGGFTLQSGQPHGFINVHTDASTTFIGAKPYVNESVSVNATGSWSTYLQAISVTQAGFATPTPVPTPVTTPPPPPAVIPSHIATWAYDEYWSRGANGTAAQAQQYLTYAQGGLGNNKATKDCGGSGTCKSVFYFDPHLLYDTSACSAPTGDLASFLNAASENWYVHLTGYTDSAHRIAGSYAYGCNGSTINVPVYAINALNPSVDTYFQSYLHTNAVGFDMFFMDDTSAQVSSQFYGPGGGFCGGTCSSTQEMPTDASVVSEHQALANALTHTDGSPMQGVFNGVTFSNGYASDLNVIQASSNFVGVACENCIVNGGNYQPQMYVEVLNAMAQVDALPAGAFLELSSGSSAPGSAAQIGQRLTTTAMAWLGYKDGHTIVWPDLEANTQNLEIFPENSIYPASPIQTMYSGANDLSVATSVYRREFVNCYNAGVAIGPCAAIVNGTSSTITVNASWLQQTYGHLVQLIGGDIPGGGTMSLTSQAFTPNTTTIAPYQGILIAR